MMLIDGNVYWLVGAILSQTQPLTEGETETEINISKHTSVVMFSLCIFVIFIKLKTFFLYRL